jgi:SOS-response transcriptional repressor LexA
MSTFGNRLRARRKQMGLEQVDLAKISGTSQSTISDIERGRNEGSKALLSLAKALRCNPIWLQTGEGTPEGPMQNASDCTTMGLQIVAVMDLSEPLKAGLGFHEVLKKAGRPMVAVRKEYGHGTFCVRVEGRAMEPDFRDGDLVVVDPSRKPQPGDPVVARTPTALLFLRFRLLSPDGSYELVPANSDYPGYRIEDGELRILGVVVEHRRLL